MDAQSGTSESAPMVAGVLALATQLNHGRNLGPVNPVLYGLLGPLGTRAGISDVVSGNNSVTDPSTGAVKVQGFTAAPGFDDKVNRGSRWRSVPDITMDAQAGTSEAAPMMAGVLALATQLNHGRNLGPINPVLYDILGPLGPHAGLSDVVSGNNSVIDSSGDVLVPGFTAARGFDVASGWGTVDAAEFGPALVAGTRATGLARSARNEATR